MNKQRSALLFLFIFAVFLIWMLFGRILESQQGLEDLIKIKGKIDQAVEVETHGGKFNTTYHELRIFLKDTSEYFRVAGRDNYFDYFERINKGDTAEIYIRPKWLIPLSAGYRNDVFQLSINGQTLFDISKINRNNHDSIIILVITILLSIFIGEWIRRRATKQ